MQGRLETDAARCAGDQDDFSRERLRIVVVLWIDERVNAVSDDRGLLLVNS